jgi:hypothetical protein
MIGKAGGPTQKQAAHLCCRIPRRGKTSDSLTSAVEGAEKFGCVSTRQEARGGGVDSTGFEGAAPGQVINTQPGPPPGSRSF